MPFSRKRRATLVTALVVAAAFAVGFVWRTVHRHQLIVQDLPSRPALSGWPAELVDNIALSEKAALGYVSPMLGVVALSRLYHANGFYHEALQCYQILQGLQPREARWLYLQVSILSAFGRLEDALPLSQRVVAQAPDYLPARLRTGDILLKTNQTAAADLAYLAVLDRAPDNPYALLGLARALIIRGDWSGARERLQQAIKVHPDFIGALSLMVAVSEHFDDKVGAAALKALIGKREFTDFPDAWLDDLGEDCYDPYRLSVLAAVANFSGDKVTARRRLERAIDLAPAKSTYRRQLGNLLLQAREFAPARQLLEKAVALEPSDSEAWMLWVTSYTASGDSAAAERVLVAGLAACPQSPALHYAYGHLLSRSGRIAAAISELKTAKKLRPNEANAFIDLAMIYFSQERMEEAVAELKGALAAQPGHPLALQVLARYAIDTGDEPAARQWIRQLGQQSGTPVDDLNQIVNQYHAQFSRAPW